jgi:lipopolysaccharide biosynthesis protein
MDVLALYLPQFHPIAENDEWWGKGFTEWTNVARARPLFRGHVQPHLPGELGFYDLRVGEVRAAQADLARRHGVTGFCYWHYWFAGRRLLERPFEEMLSSGEPDFPFCVAWANQSWSGVWHGAPDKVLVEQTYPESGDDEAHFATLLPAFEDRRYITVAGRPLLFVYQPGSLPNPARFVERWQKMAHDAGLGGLYLVASLGESAYRGHVADGFDAAVYYRFPFDRTVAARVGEHLLAHHLSRGPRRYPYPDTLPEPPAGLGGTILPSVYPNWDNTPRLGRRGMVATGATPERFGRQVRRALELAAANPAGEQMVVIKSWNEWAEGNYLEPDVEFGTGRLEALRREVAAVQPPGGLM